MTKYPKAKRIHILIDGECHRLVLTRREDDECYGCSFRRHCCNPNRICLALKEVVDPDGLWADAHFVRERKGDAALR